MASILVLACVDSLVWEAEARLEMPQVRADDNGMGGGEMKLVIEKAKLAKRAYVDHKGCMCPLGHFLLACGHDPRDGIYLEALKDPRIQWLNWSSGTDEFLALTTANDKDEPDFATIIEIFGRHDVEVTFV